MIDVIDAVRAAGLLAFLAVGPGLAWVRLLDVPSGALRWALVVGVSLAVDTLAALALVYAGIWSPVAVLAVLVAVSVAGVITGRAARHLRLEGR